MPPMKIKQASSGKKVARGNSAECTKRKFLEENMVREDECRIINFLKNIENKQSAVSSTYHQVAKKREMLHLRKISATDKLQQINHIPKRFNMVKIDPERLALERSVSMEISGFDCGETPATTSSEYGWWHRDNDTPTIPVAPCHGKKTLLATTFYSTNGVDNCFTLY